jgi:hypothetical protein
MALSFWSKVLDRLYVISTMPPAVHASAFKFNSRFWASSLSSLLSDQITAQQSARPKEEHVPISPCPAF